MGCLACALDTINVRIVWSFNKGSNFVLSFHILNCVMVLQEFSNIYNIIS